MSQFMVQPQDIVRKGQVIGLAGATGRANGPHLHFEVIVNGFPVDPLKWLALAPGFVAPREVTPVPNESSSTGS
jgi:murein DD-endopeptidase MepM/ murein hydrolase activator NlpD